MGSQLLIKQNVKTVNLKTHIPVFVASRVRPCDLGLVCDACLDHYILYSVKHLIITDSVFLEIIFQLHQVPFGGVLVLTLAAFSFHVVVSPLVDRVISQMDVSLLKHFGIVCVLLGGKPHQAFLVEENFEWLKAGDNHIDSEVILKAIDQMRVGDVLADNISWLLIYLGFRSNHLDSLTAAAC